MRNIKGTNCLLMVSLLMVSTAASAIPWPVAISHCAGPDYNNNYTLMKTYGTMNKDWDDVGPGASTNFHSGIDIAAVEIGNDSVFCVEDGELTYKWPESPGEDEYRVVICPLSSDEGWYYKHLRGKSGDHGWVESALIGSLYYEGYVIAEMYTGVAPTPHLHFEKSLREPSSGSPGLDNPLDFLEPAASAAENFIWSVYSPEQLKQTFFLPNYLAFNDPGDLDWENIWQSAGDVYADTIDRTSLNGAVDLFFNVACRGQGEIGVPSGDIDPSMPQKLQWTLSSYDAGTASWVEVFTKYVVDFDGEVGCSGSLPESDWQEYKRFYFRYWGHEIHGVPGPKAYVTCLTNCGDAAGYNGINNIEENCWQTDIKSDLSGPTNNTVLQLTPDGHYQVEVIAYAWDETFQCTETIDVELHNSSPIVSKAEILDESKAVIWDAFWNAEETLSGLEAELVINVNESVLLDQTLTATVVFSEPVNTSSIDITAGKPPYYNDLTVTTTGWSCTNNPEPYYDTWHGTIEVPVEGISGAIKLCIDGEDNDGNCLKDPAGAFTDEVDNYSDTYHGFSIAFSSEEGWPVFLSHVVKGSPVLGDLDGDGDLDIALQCNDGDVQLIDEAGNILQTLESGDWSEFFYPLTSSPAIADLDLDGDMDVLAVHPYGCNAWDAATGSLLDGWPVDMGYGYQVTGIYPSHSAPAVCDLIGDAHPEVVICRHLDLTQPYAVCTVWMFDYLGNIIWQRPLESGEGVSVASTPAVGNVSSIHSGNEIVVCTSDGFVSNFPPPDGGMDFSSAVYLLDPSDGSNIWKTSFNCWFFGSPVVADIDGDGINEIIIGTHIDQVANRVLVLNGDDGILEHTFYVNSTIVNSAGIADLNDDGILDIVAVDNTGHVYCWSGEGFSGGSQYDPLPGFPVVLTDAPTSPSIADIDGDNELEIVVGTDDGCLYAINSDGSICSGYPVTVPGLNSIVGQPVIANLDNDDSLELMFADGSDSYAYCYDLGAGTFPAEMPWRQFQHDSWHTGCFEADNTIPEPPTNLSGEITYKGGNCKVDLWWDLSVNDPFSGSPQEPTDVLSYAIYRQFRPGLLVPPQVVGTVNAGDGTYTDFFSGSTNPVVAYWVTSRDGTNESEFSNHTKFPTSPTSVISVGCSVVEEFSVERASTMTIRIPDRVQISEMDVSSNIESTSVRERTTETIPAAILDVLPAAGNPCCLTDGSVEVCYAPSSGADAVVIDLGEECTVTSIMPERISDNSSAISLLTVESVRTVGTALAVEPSLLIEVAGSDREFYAFAAESYNSTDAVRYVRIHGASGLTEISVHGSRGAVIGVSSVEITRSVENEGWMFAIPVVEYSEEASVKIYDVSGRMIWSGHGESGSVLHWDGFTENGTPVPNGVYLLQCSIGSEVSTGSFVVMRD